MTQFSKYKSWSNLKRLLGELLCDGLKGRISYFYTRYHKDRGSFGRVTINIDKTELVAFSWDVGLNIQWQDEYGAFLDNPDTNQASVHSMLMKEKWMPQGTLCHMDFLEAVTAYLNTDITTALYSDNYVMRALAYMDRRVGKRTLIKIKKDAEALPKWVKQFYDIRCLAEGIDA